MARDALLSAALRHIRDAEHLLTPGPHRSVEQALHLAGFGPECARKGCIDEAIADRALGHDIKHVTDAVVEVLLDGTVLDAEPFAALRTRIVERAGRAEFVDEEDDDDGGEGPSAG